jgi:hypothetical protein
MGVGALKAITAATDPPETSQLPIITKKDFAFTWRADFVRSDLLHFASQVLNCFSMVSAARRASAATVEVGFAVELVGNTLLPTTKRFG